jgi:uncharacterized protein YndB with AHSA1/START domain
VRSATVTTVLDATPERVFRYMSDVENLPEWATEFARELRREGGDYKVRNGSASSSSRSAPTPRPA